MESLKENQNLRVPSGVGSAASGMKPLPLSDRKGFHASGGLDFCISAMENRDTIEEKKRDISWGKVGTSRKKKIIKLQDRDLLALQWVCEQGAMTLEQVWMAAFRINGSNSMSYAYRRVGQLCDAGFLRAVSAPELTGRFFVVTPRGRDVTEWRLRLPMPFAAPRLEEFPQAEWLTNIRLLIQRAGVLKRWQSVRTLVLDPKFPRDRFQKHIPDALWTNQSDCRIVIEYERVRQIRTRLRKQIEAYSREICRVDRYMDHVLWIAEGPRYDSIKKVLAYHQHPNHSVRTFEQFSGELKVPRFQNFKISGRGELNSRPLAPQAGQAQNRDQ